MPERQWNNGECNVPSQKEKEILWIHNLTQELLKDLWNSITKEKEATSEQIEENINNLRSYKIEWARKHMNNTMNVEKKERYKQYIAFLEKAEIMHIWGWIYAVQSFDYPWNIWSYFSAKAELLVKVSRERDTFPQEYKDILEYLGVVEKYDKDTGIFHMYESDCWKKGKEIKQNTIKYHQLFIKIRTIRAFNDVQWIINNPKRWLRVNNIFRTWLEMRVITFKNIEDLIGFDMISDAQYNQAKKEIPKFFFRLVFVWLVKTKEEVIDAEKYFEDKELYKKSVKEWNRQHPDDIIDIK